MNIENYIESQYRKIYSDLNIEFIELYKCFKSQKLQEIFATIHHLCVENYKLMNQRLPTRENGNYFWADPSRKLIFAIDIALSMQRTLKNSEYAFEIVDYYKEVFRKSEEFLSNSRGSQIPPNMEKIEIYYTMPILLPVNTIKIDSGLSEKNIELKLIGEGSYAKVFSFFDDYYNRKFVLKRAKKHLNEKEVKRFKQEFEQMNSLSSPYIVEVYRYENDTNEYIMEFMDCTLYDYIQKNNSKLTQGDRKLIVNQILRAFRYIHSKGLFHRDVSPKNILLKKYDDVNVIKVSDFGLVKVPDNNLTTINTEFKGYFNDPRLLTEGFYNYGILHETFAITRLVYFVMSGKTRIDNIKDVNLSSFVNKGLSVNLSERYQSVDEIINAVKKL
ncbi:protein kinase family protein [uncultured Peptoniphilus sp.]|uniref:protein kinase family protein n=1 Tax=uncultured Peptoniphilus sp. TaxID=254354 RepID=UPI0028048E24|nr:protein kinase family protein [uncultured Peptoniphilus sp.]